MSAARVKTRPRFTDPAKAWRVTSFMHPEPREQARVTQTWHSPADEAQDRKWVSSRGDLGIDALARVTPSGRYTQLRVPVAYPSGERDFKCVMSDAPAEYADHADLIEHARGRVLMHGLGLGCALSAILAKREVEHVDVVEINPDVLTIVAPYFTGYPVTFHHASCIDQRWPAQTRWNYVWHDIWTWITDKNLDETTAEHGISYDRMFELFEGRCDRQGAWAHDLALALREHEQVAA